MEKVYSFGRHSSDPNIQVHLWNGKEAVYRSTRLKDAGRRKEERTGREWGERETEHGWGKNTEKAQKYCFNIFLLESNKTKLRSLAEYSPASQMFFSCVISKVSEQVWMTCQNVLRFAKIPKSAIKRQKSQYELQHFSQDLSFDPHSFHFIIHIHSFHFVL